LGARGRNPDALSKRYFRSILVATIPPSQLSLFSPATREWFESTLGPPTRAQQLGFVPIVAGQSTLLLAPTGSGKTLAAFLAAVDRLMHDPEPPGDARCRVLYVSPLKALAVDIERNLRAPIAGISEAARTRGDAVRAPVIGVRTGDTSPADRARMRRRPPDILITTPESLFLLLTSESRRILASVATVIVDEIHSLVASKRGAHLFLSLERLESLEGRRSPLQRIGLSATQRPLDEVARLLGGFDDQARPRPVTIVDAGQRKAIDLSVELPEPREETARDEHPQFRDVPSGPAGAGSGGGRARSIWPAVHERLVSLIRGHRTTMIFANSRRLSERLAAAINEVAGEELALAHHGSVAREKRQQIEERLKSGQLPAIVATSSLELGLDIGSVDLVVQIESPPSIAAGLQRIGRAHHQVGGTPSGVIIPKHRADLLASAAATRRMLEGEVEETFYPRNPLDVLAQQIVAMCAVRQYAVDELFGIVRRASSYAELPESAFLGVLDMLAGRYPSDEFAELRPRVVWDRVLGTVRGRTGALRLAVANAGTIPDRGLYGVFLMAENAERGSRRVGELDEEMVFELREGEVFLLGASSWRAEVITHDRVLVSPAAGQPGKMPFWHGDRPGRPRAFGIAIGKLTRALAAEEKSAVRRLLTAEHRLDPAAAAGLAAYVAEQVDTCGVAPTDRQLVIERFIDEVGDHRVCILSPLGTRVHAPWAIAVTERLRQSRSGEIESVWSDDGMVFRLPAAGQPPDVELFLPKADEVEALVTRALEGTSLFAARFREAAGRALLLPRRSPTTRQPLWATRKRAADLLAVASRHPSFPIVLETFRECLRDVFDLPGLVATLRDVESRRLAVTTLDTTAPSPFSTSLLFSFVANFIYDGDAPAAERRAQALRIDHERLRELLGETEMRNLLDGEVIAEHEAMLQHLARPAKNEDGLSDILRAVGDLSLSEVAARCEPADRAEAWLSQLERERRAFQSRIHGEVRWVAAEDAGRLRDALGSSPPPGLAAIFLESTADPAGELVLRYARTHGPFLADALAQRYGLAPMTIAEVTARLERSGKLVRGAFLPGGQKEELCDSEVLRALRRKSLARLRREVEPVDPAAFARFLPDWQNVEHKRRGHTALLEAIAQLQGCPIPASALLADVLPARVSDFTARDLDALCASGQVVWAGVESLGQTDGRLALYLAEHEPLLSRPPVLLDNPGAAQIRELLSRRGAVFFDEIARTVGGLARDVLATLWDMVWSGEVTNDTLDPLRSLLRGEKRDNRRERMRSHRGQAFVGAARSRIAGSEGRWSLRSARWPDAPSDTERRTALARSLLDRYGIITREAVHAEGIAGGFSSVYEILKTMEEGGRVRRGYFIAGQGGVQFALPGADERLRARRDGEEGTTPLVLSAVDPANPYGASLPWPARGEDGEGPRFARTAGAYVIVADGVLLGYVSRSGQSLTTVPPESEPLRSRAPALLASALVTWATRSRLRVFYLAQIDAIDARQHPAAAEFLRAGFLDGGRALLLRAGSKHSADERVEEEDEEEQGEEKDAGG
jgi:ATP-dependent helicase Lhr and Lhr-like helicase